MRDFFTETHGEKRAQTPAEKLDDLLYIYLEAHNRNIPKFIAMTERDYQELRHFVCKNLPRELHYFPKFYHGIPVVASRSDMVSKCLP